MSRRIFFLFFLLLFVCCQLCQKGRAAQSEPLANTNGKVIDEFLKPEDNNILKELKLSGPSNNKVKHIDLVSLVSANGVIFAMAEVNYTENGERKIAVLAKYFETKQDGWDDEAFGENGEKCDLKSFAGNVKATSSNAVIKSFAVATKGNTIYYITVSNSTFEESESSKPLPAPPAAEWHVRVVKGEVNNGVGGKTGKKEIKWETPEIFGVTEEGTSKKLNTQPSNIPPSDGFAFVTGDDSIFFFMKGKTKNDNKNIVAVFEFDVKGSKKKLKLLPDNVPQECYPSFFEWEEKIYKAPTDDPKCISGKMMVFDENTNTFSESREPIAFLLDFLKDKRNFTNAVIGANNVLLFIQQKSLTQKGDVNLWMYDGTRVGFVGDIFKNIKGTFYGSLLYTDKGLFALHAKYKNNNKEDGTKEDNTFSLTLLKEQLDKIKNIFLNEWENNKETVLKLCDNINKQKIICTKAPPTDGLVGFLHSTINGDTGNVIWKDEYCFSNVAVVKGKAENAPNGLKFSGEKKGAKWVMKRETGDQPYNFITSGFTLVATVEIGSDTNGKKNSILGIKLTSTTNTNNNVGLWCNTDGKWGVSDRDGSALKLSGKECKQGNTYNVALVLNENKRVWK